MTYTVIVDTTTVTKNQSFDSADWLRLLSLSRLAHVNLIVPEIVLMEAGRQWHEHLMAQFEKISSAQLEIRKSLEVLDMEPFSFEDISNSWDRKDYVRVMSRELRSHEATVAHVPDISIHTLIEQDLDTKKPFKRNGQGFRDAIVWESVRKAEAKSDALVYFVSNNTNDYCDSSGNLHSDLLTSLKKPEKLIHVKNLKELFELKAFQEFEPHLEVVAKGVDSQEIYERVEAILSNMLNRSVLEQTGTDLAQGVWLAPVATHLDNSIFSHIEPYEHSLKWNVFRSPHPDELVISAEIEAECEIEGFLEKGDARLANLDNVQIIDPDWNVQLMLLSESASVKFRFVGNIDLERIDQFSLEFDDAITLDHSLVSH